MAEKEGCLSLLTGLFPKSRTAPAAMSYRAAASLLTPVELAFYRTLREIVGDKGTICPKVRLADLVRIDARDDYMSHFGRISQKHIDFVICDPQTMKPQFAIELDDSSHQKSHRQERDSFVNELFQTIGIPLVRMPALSEYSVDITRKTLAKRLTEARGGNPG